MSGVTVVVIVTVLLCLRRSRKKKCSTSARHGARTHARGTYPLALLRAPAGEGAQRRGAAPRAAAGWNALKKIY